MQTWVSKLIALALIFILTLVSGLLPIKLLSIIQPSDSSYPPSTLSKHRAELVLSCLNCFAGGVFLSVTMLDLLPDVRAGFEFVLKDLGQNSDFPLAEFVTCLGFFLVMLIESMVIQYQRRRGLNRSRDIDISQSGESCAVVIGGPGPICESTFYEESDPLLRESDSGMEPENWTSPVIEPTRYSSSAYGSLEPRHSDNIMRQAKLYKTDLVSSRRRLKSGSDLGENFDSGPAQDGDEIEALLSQEETAEIDFVGVLHVRVDREPRDVLSKSDSTPRPSQHEHNDMMRDRGHSKYSSEGNSKHSREGHSMHPHEDHSRQSHGGHSHGIPFSDDRLHSLRSLVLLIALSTHTIFEGMALGLQSTTRQVWTLFTAIILHKIIMAFTAGLRFMESLHSVKRTVLYMLIFSLTAPIGITIGLAVTETGSSGLDSDITSTVLQGVATGTFIYVTFFEVLLEEMTSDQSVGKVLAVIIGFSVIAGLMLIDHGEPDSNGTEPH